MKSLLTYCLALLLLGSCIDNVAKETGVIENLQHEILDFPTMILGSVGDIQKNDDYLIISDFKQEALFHIVNLKDVCYGGMFGIKGQGPREFIHPSSLNSLRNGVLSSYDAFKNELKMILLNADGKIVEIAKVLGHNRTLTFDIVPMSDSIFVLNGETEGAMFALIDSENEVVSISDKYPFKDEAEELVPERFRAMAYQGTLRVNSNGYFAYVTVHAKQLHLYKVENNKINKIGEVIESYGYYKPNMDYKDSYSVVHSGNYPNCYIDLAVSDDYIYALYSGRTFKEYQMSSFEGETIYVYDWTGKLVKTYRLDTPITKFCVDEAEKVIYATANIPDPTIVCFEYN